MSTQPQYVIVIRALKSHLPIENRLKGFLKVALRAFKLQAVSIKPITENQKPNL